MEKPKCRLCGKRHWFSEGCIWEDKTEDMANMANKEEIIPETMANTENHMANRKNRMANRSAYKYRNAEKRRLYMRDYMRKKRQEMISWRGNNA